MPPSLTRYPGGHVQGPYHPQYQAHTQNHANSHTHSYVSANNQFSHTNGGLVGNVVGLGNGFTMDGPRLAFQAANFQQQQPQPQQQGISNQGAQGPTAATLLQQQQQHHHQQQQQQQQQLQQQLQHHQQQAQSQSQKPQPHQHQQMQQQQQQQRNLQHAQYPGAADFTQALRNQPNKARIREVWKHNLHEEMAMIRVLIEKYPYVAMDTEFPGVVARPMGSFRGKSDYHYQCLRTNVDMLRVIQVGITLFNEAGETPPARPSPEQLSELPLSASKMMGPLPYAWQFNFKFSLNDDMYNEKSIESLQVAGIDFNLLDRDGIDPYEFAALLIPSGLVCFDNVKWISFHGGYDFCYLIKLLICQSLPNDEVDFDRLMKVYFPATFDVKHLLKHAIKMHNSGLLTPLDSATLDILLKFEHKSGLENIAETLKIKRVGSAHQAGSDALLTGRVFFQMKDRIYRGEIPDEHVGKIWGLHIPDMSYGAPTITSGVDNSYVNNNNNSNNGNNNNGNNNNNGPSTPVSHTVGLASTPSALQYGTQTPGISGPMTPGSGGGVFGSFAIPGMHGR